MAFTKVAVLAPDSAVAGSRVSVDITIENISDSRLHVAAIGVIDSEERFIDWLEDWLIPLEVRYFSGSFIMPDRDIIVHAYSYYESGGFWYSDDEAAKNINLAKAYTGSITRKELDYDAVRVPFPLE